jgi:hypothetical protein
MESQPGWFNDLWGSIFWWRGPLRRRVDHRLEQDPNRWSATIFVSETGWKWMVCSCLFMFILFSGFCFFEFCGILKHTNSSLFVEKALLRGVWSNISTPSSFLKLMGILVSDAILATCQRNFRCFHKSPVWKDSNMFCQKTMYHSFLSVY